MMEESPADSSDKVAPPTGALSLFLTVPEIVALPGLGLVVLDSLLCEAIKIE